MVRAAHIASLTSSFSSRKLASRSKLQRQSELPPPGYSVDAAMTEGPLSCSCNILAPSMRQWYLFGAPLSYRLCTTQGPIVPTMVTLPPTLDANSCTSHLVKDDPTTIPIPSSLTTPYCQRLTHTVLPPIDISAICGDWRRCNIIIRFSLIQHNYALVHIDSKPFSRVKKEFEDSGGVGPAGPHLATIPDEDSCVADGGGGVGSSAGAKGPEGTTASFGGPYRRELYSRFRILLVKLLQS